MTKISRSKFNAWYKQWHSDHCSKFLGPAFMKEFFPEIEDIEVKAQIKNSVALNHIMDRYVDNSGWEPVTNTYA
jgi:hypothetical protein